MSMKHYEITYSFTTRNGKPAIGGICEQAQHDYLRALYVYYTEEEITS